MDYLLTVVEERSRQVTGMGGGKPTDIRFSVKEGYLRFFDEKPDGKETAEDFEIAPTLGVRDGDQLA